MKAKVLKTFRDKYTRAVHKKGSTIEVSKERFEEMNSTSLFVEEIKEDKKEEVKKKAKK